MHASVRRLASLSAGARALLEALAATRFLATVQAVRLLGSADEATRAIRQLRAAGLVDRVVYRPDPLGPRTFVLALSRLGTRAALAMRSHAQASGGAFDPALQGREFRASQAARDGEGLSYLFLTHHLAVSDLYVAVRARHEGPGPVIWRTGPEARIRFRSFLQAGGESNVIPDALIGRTWDAATGTPEEAVALELDRGTMGREAIRQKLLRYREFFAESGRRWPVFFVARDPGRRNWLYERLGEARLRGRALDAGEATATLLVWLRTGREELSPASPGGDPGEA